VVYRAARSGAQTREYFHMGHYPHTALHAAEGQSAPPRRRLSMVIAGVAALALLLVACGQNSAASGGAGGGGLKLSCVTIVGGQGIDVVTAHLTCHVTGASSSDTSFTLKYTVKDDSGQSRTFTSVCKGPLQNGAGSCSQTYTAPVPFPLTPATVSGYTEPGHQALGPLTPTEQTATLAPGQHL
jgi:hypothetical protein